MTGGTSVKSPFDILNAIFDLSGKTYKEISDKDKERNFFIINRRLAIGFPTIAFGLSKLNINGIYAIDFWHNFFTSKRVTKPSWMYMKLDKSPVNKKIKYTEEAKDYYLKNNEIGEKEFNFAIEYNFDSMQEYLKILDKQFKLIKSK